MVLLYRERTARALELRVFKGWKLGCSAVQVRKWFLHSSDAILELKLLLKLQVEPLLGDTSRVLKEAFCEGVVLTLNAFVLLAANRDVKRSGTHAACCLALLVFVDGGAVHG